MRYQAGKSAFIDLVTQQAVSPGFGPARLHLPSQAGTLRLRSAPDTRGWARNGMASSIPHSLIKILAESLERFSQSPRIPCDIETDLVHRVVAQAAQIHRGRAWILRDG